MSNCLVFEDGVLIENSIKDNVLWAGLFSVALGTGKIIEYVQSCLPKNTIFVIPRSDGNINKMKDNNFHDVDWDKRIQPHLDYAKKKNKVFILGTLCQIDEEKDINYLYIPLDDNFFNYGINNYFNSDNFPSWDRRSSNLCWRGSCAGVGGSRSLRARFVEAIHKYDINENVKLSKWWRNGWHDGNSIPEHYFSDRLDYTEFLNYKIFFIVDGACIASNHMYGFATGAIPFLLSNAKCWFSHLIVPYVHYIPVNYDLSNLIEQIEWVKNNDDQAKIIANNASQFSKIYFSSEYQNIYIKENIEKIFLKCDDNFIKNKSIIENKLKIKYGLIDNNIDVTDICLLKLINNNIITIPAGDNNRDKYFGDPAPYILKKIFIIINDTQIEYEDFYTIKINILNNILNNEINTHHINTINTHDIDHKTASIQSNLKIMFGSFNDELPEQKMVVRYLTGNEKVLEIGGNIGRNSLIIASILLNNEYFLTLESDKNTTNQLIENRDLNNFNFKIENSALSKRKLIQKGWLTEVSDDLKEGYTWVNTITLDELKLKYNIEFDTLILDCEGAFYYILMDMPEILNNINLIIMENDYCDIYKKQYIDNVLFKNNFYIDYVESGGWGPCYNNFYEVWKK
jgi:FkbM family methyltransferase